MIGVSPANILLQTQIVIFETTILQVILVSDRMEPRLGLAINIGSVRALIWFPIRWRPWRLSGMSMLVPNQLVLVGIGDQIALLLCYRVEFFLASGYSNAFQFHRDYSFHPSRHYSCVFRASLLHGVKKSVHCHRCGGGQ